MKRIYGSQNTHLNLTDKAQHFYDVTQPLTIIEHEIENDEDDNFDTVYLYSIKEPEWNMTKPVTEDEMVSWLEMMDGNEE